MIASKGRVSKVLIHSRRVMLANSGLAAAAVTVRGSSAMPQIGQAPGPSRTICGCMGQVYSVRSFGAAGCGCIQRHAALRACPRLRGEHLGMHGAGVLRGRGGLGGRPNWYQGRRRGNRLRAVIFARTRLEFCPAALGTEVPGAACVLDRCRRLFRYDLHAANRVAFCQNLGYHL